MKLETLFKIFLPEDNTIFDDLDFFVKNDTLNYTVEKVENDEDLIELSAPVPTIENF